MTSSKPILGVNDLQSQFPEIAAEANGWDPETITAKSNQKKEWKCKEGHIYSSTVGNRTGNESGCPVCSGNQVLSGFNDLKTKFPDIAAEAYEWDTSTVSPKGGRIERWRCPKGHIYEARISDRTVNSSGCSFCSGKKVLIGFNDLESQFPLIASESQGWNPRTITSGSNKKMLWKCPEGHSFTASVKTRTKSNGTGCPYCSGNRVLKGFNDLRFLFPQIAMEAQGWDPESVTSGSSLMKNWKCRSGHSYEKTVKDRTGEKKSGCPVCKGFIVVEGFNDLNSLFPEIASEAYGWDPRQITSGSNIKKKWKCAVGHIFTATVKDRTRPKGTGCPDCATYGFSPNNNAWMYLMGRSGEQQVGITNNLEQRMSQHRKNGWGIIDQVGPCPGRIILDTETSIKRWLQTNVGIIKGTYENWSTTKMEVQSLAELKARSGIETDLF